MSIANLDCEKCGAPLTAYRGVPYNRVRRWPSRNTVFALAVLFGSIIGIVWTLYANGWLSLSGDANCVEITYPNYRHTYCR